MTQTFTVADPLTFEGTPFEVAARSIAQIRAIVHVAIETIEASETMIRNAELSRNLYATPEDARADEWENSPQARKLRATKAKLLEVRSDLKILERAAGFDPRNLEVAP